MDYYYYAGYIAEFLAAISAAVFLYKYKKSQLIWLLPLLWYIPINELICQYIFSGQPVGFMLKNIYRVVVPLSIILLVLSQVQKRKPRTIIKFIAIINTALVILELLTINPFETKTSFSFTIASILIVICLLIYFIEELKGNHLFMANRNLFVLICFGFLIFHVPFPVLIYAQKNISTYSNDIVRALYKIHFIIAILSYLMIAFGFYWGDKITSPSPSVKNR